MCSAILISHRTSSWSLKARTPSRNVLSQTASSGEINQTSRPCYHGGPQTSRCGCGDGVQPFVYGHEGSAEDWGYDDHKLHAGLHAVEREDEG